MKPGKNEENAWDLLARYGSLGLELVVAVLIGAGGGYWLDQKLGTLPLFLLIGFVLGSAAGFLNIFRLIASENKKKGSGSKQ